MLTSTDFKNIYLTGDTHGEFRELVVLSRAIGITENDLLIILGDVGVNYDNGNHDINAKHSLCRVPATVLCVHGNHERRPDSKDIRWHYYETEWHGGTVWYEKKFPRLLFAKDGCRYAVNGRSFFVIGGAYSVDKISRRMWGAPWFPDEQPSKKIKGYCRHALKEHGYQEDIILSHTCAYSDRPKDCLMPGIDESTVDTSTEEFLQEIKEAIT